MQRYELDAWLGDDHGLTDEQVDDLARAAKNIEELYPDPDDADDREAALITAHQVISGDGEALVAEQAVKLARARRAEHQALVALRQAAVMLVRPSAKKGDGIASAKGFAQTAGVDRQAVLGWLGRR